MINAFDGVPVLRRRLARFALAPGAVLVIVGVVMYLRAGRSGAVVAWALLVAVAFAWVFVWWRMLRAFAKRRVIQTRGLCCTGCGYSMVSLEAGNCPECGKSYYAELATRSWSRAAGMPFEE